MFAPSVVQSMPTAAVPPLAHVHVLAAWGVSMRGSIFMWFTEGGGCEGRVRLRARMRMRVRVEMKVRMRVRVSKRR